MTGDERPAARILGSLRTVHGTGVVRIEDRYDTDIDDLWDALTDPGRLSRWYGQVEGDLRQGGEFRTNVAGAHVEAVGRVEACEIPVRLLVSTRETEESYRRGHGTPPWDGAIEVTLSADGEGTTLVIEVRGMPLETIGSYGAGWQMPVESLSAYVAGRDRADAATRWDELVPRYRQLAADIT